jgi:sarcosine oxidase subunit alpha
LKPRRTLPLHDWHEAAGATFVNAGLWLRPLVYSQLAGWEPVLAEARAVRRGVGVCDVSSLGKIDVQGPDAARFLDFIYASPVASLPVGRARYGLMLREDGMLLDDGTVARLARSTSSSRPPPPTPRPCLSTWNSICRPAAPGLMWC